MIDPQFVVMVAVCMNLCSNYSIFSLPMFLTLVDYSGVKSQTIVRTLETLGVNGHDPVPVRFAISSD